MSLKTVWNEVVDLETLRHRLPILHWVQSDIQSFKFTGCYTETAVFHGLSTVEFCLAQETALEAMTALLGLFVKDNVTGPKLKRELSEHPSPKEEFASQPDSKLAWLGVDGHDQQRFRSLVGLQLEVDGEIPVDSIDRAWILWMILYISACLAACVNPSVQRLQDGLLMGTHLAPSFRAKLAFLWQQCLQSSPTCVCPTLAKVYAIAYVHSVRQLPFVQSRSNIRSSMESIVAESTYLREARQLSGLDSQQSHDDVEHSSTHLAAKIHVDPDQSDVVRSLIELAKYYTFLKDPCAIRFLQLAETLLGIKVVFGSMIGIRRKYQQVPVALIVVKLQSTDDQHTMVHPQKDQSIVKDLGVPLSELDIDTDLLEVPKFECSDPEVDRLPTTEELLILLSHCHYLLKAGAVPKDFVTVEQCRALIERCLRPFHLCEDALIPWLVEACALYLRSLCELDRVKTRGRSLAQLYALSTRTTSTLPEVSERLECFWETPYPLCYQLAREVAFTHKKAGAYITAADMFMEECLFEDAVECYLIANRKVTAENLLSKALEIYPENPRLLLCKGILLDDPSYFEKAWQASNHRYAKAQSLLGFHAMSQNDLSKAINHFQAALKLNHRNDRVWYSLGSCQLRLSLYKDALSSFQAITCMTSELEVEAWTNMAAIHHRLGAHKSTILCMKEALKQRRSNLELWKNLVKASLLDDDLSNLLYGVQGLLQNDFKHQIEDWILNGLAQLALKGSPSDLENAIQFVKYITEQFISDRVKVFDILGTLVHKAKDPTLAYESYMKAYTLFLVNLPEKVKPPFTPEDIENEVIALLQNLQLVCTPSTDSMEKKNPAIAVGEILNGLDLMSSLLKQHEAYSPQIDLQIQELRRLIREHHT